MLLKFNQKLLQINYRKIKSKEEKEKNPESCLFCMENFVINEQNGLKYKGDLNKVCAKLLKKVTKNIS